MKLLTTIIELLCDKRVPMCGVTELKFATIKFSDTHFELVHFELGAFWVSDF